MSPAAHRSVRAAAVAGAFYPADPETLREVVAECFAGAVAPVSTHVPKALIVPHAGYAYSGPIAASAYACIAPSRADIRRVVLLGPSHRVPLRGLAVAGVEAFETPLGSVAVDGATRSSVLEHSAVQLDDVPHDLEHSLEVQLPFLRSVLGDFAIVPLVVGDATTDDVAEVLDICWGGPDTLVVVSTDLSHFLPYDEATAVDRRTAFAITSTRFDAISDRDACGSRPLRGLLAIAARDRLSVEQLDLRNSGDTAGDRERVVGYGAFAVG